MKKQNLKGSAVVLSVTAVLWLAANVFAADAKSMEGDAAKAGAPAMDEAMMAKMQEYGTPNENHKVLQQLVGSWEYSVKMWMAPDAPPDESTGNSEVSAILGGRFIQEISTGTAHNQPFEGRGICGYDNVKKEYNHLWIDNMGTGMMMVSASYDAATKTFSGKGNMSCPINGPMSIRTVMKILDVNTHTYEMYMPDKSGKEFKAMEITYRRKS